MTTIQSQNFGVEIELTGITRPAAANIIKDYFGTRAVGHLRDGYDTYTATDRKGRTWKCSRDISITPQVRRNGRVENRYEGRTPSDLRCEVVTPILQYDDMDDLQEIVRKLREAGALANSSCGIHVHVDGANHNVDSLTRLVNFSVSRQDLFYEALEIGDRANRWCKRMNANLLKAMKNVHTRDDLERVWYSSVNDGYNGRIDHSHYNPTRYHGINLHAFFTKGTVEFRLFNGTTHAGKIKSYVQFCLAMSAWAINADKPLHFAGLKKYETKAQRGTLMKNVMKNRLGMRGPEFKTARLHLTSAFAEEAVA